MIWVFLGLVGFILISVCIFTDDWNDWADKFLYTSLALVCAGLLSFLCLLISSLVVTEVANIEYEKANDIDIIALKDNQNVNGRIYLMGGYVEEDLYYYYAKETEYGYKTDKIKAEDCYIKYTDEQPHIEEYEAKFTSDVAKAFGFPIDRNRYIIYCPENTITNEFKIDLE